MPKKSNITKSFFAIIATLWVAHASAQALYNVDLTVDDANAKGFVFGVTGNSSADVSAPFDLTLTEDLLKKELFATVTGSGNAQVAAGNSDAITVTPKYIFFNFANPNQDFLKFYLSGGGFPGDHVMLREQDLPAWTLFFSKPFREKEAVQAICKLIP